MKTLVVYYSLTGTTKAVAEALAAELHADIEPLVSTKSYKGIFGYLRAGRDSFRGKLPAIETTKLVPESYDLVVIGAPVWVSHSATPIRRYLEDHEGRLKRVALFVTYGGSGDEPALAEMADLAGVSSEANLTIRADAVKNDTFRADISAFADSLRLKQAA